MKVLAFRLYLFVLSKLTGTGLGQLSPIKWVYKHLRQVLLPKDAMLMEIHGLKMYQHGRHDYLDSDETLFTDGYERTQTEWFNKLVKKGMIVIDIGANIGYYALLACKNVGENGRVYAYEPDPTNYRLLVKNIEANTFKNAVSYQLAVSDNDGETELYLSPKGHGEHSFYNSDENLGCFKVDTVSLDNYLNGQKVDIVKMDIEGAELSALVGMQEIAKKNDNLKMFVEFCPSHFYRAGYTPEELWHKLFECGFAYIYILDDKKRRLVLSDCKYAIMRCGKNSSVNLLCAKQPVVEVDLIGAYPPPYGGVSVHVKRLKEGLDVMGVPCKVYSYTGASKDDDGVVRVGNRMAWYLKELFSNDRDIIHCHGYSPLALACLSILSLVKRKRIMLTAHGFLFKSDKVALWHRFAFRLASLANIYFVVTSSQVISRILSLGIKPQNMTPETVSAFIPPNGDAPIVSEEVKRFIEAHGPLVVANAYRIVFFKGIDLYGLDMCVELVARLKAEYSNIGLVFSLPDIGDYKYYHRIQQEIRDKDVSRNILIMNYPCEFYPILKRCDVFVRPTCVDDYGVSIAEAIYFGMPAVASDVCQRAEGTALFKSRDMDDFEHKVREVLRDYKRYKQSLKRVRFGDTVERLIDVYRSL